MAFCSVNGFSLLDCYNHKIIVSRFLKICFVLANSVDPDKIPHYAAFHLCLHCLPKYAFKSY